MIIECTTERYVNRILRPTTCIKLCTLEIIQKYCYIQYSKFDSSNGIRRVPVLKYLVIETVVLLADGFENLHRINKKSSVPNCKCVDTIVHVNPVFEIIT